MMELLESKGLTAEIKADLSRRIADLAERGAVPCLAVLRIGARPDDLAYERSIVKRAGELGVEVRSIELPEDVDDAGVAEAIEAINADASIHGCLIFRPFPKGLDEQELCNLLAPEKDVDGITFSSLAGVFADRKIGYPPCTAAACVELLDYYHVPLEGKNVVVIGRSLVVGKPVSLMLLGRHASVMMCHSRTTDLKELMRHADVVICATGRARMFDKYYFVPGQTVLDVGINFDEDGKLCGDVDFDSVANVVDALTPVPGGVGSLTTVMTLKHTVEACEKACAMER